MAKKYTPPADPMKNIYRAFPDGVDFTPDVGNGKTRGEVFTPLFIVEKMITTSGMIPGEIVYDNDFSGFTVDDLVGIIGKTVTEPAVGTGNFSATIVYYKMRIAAEVYGRTGDEQQYGDLITTIVGATYVNDIDPGNVEVTFRRIITGDTTPYDDQGTTDYWVDYLMERLGCPHKDEVVDYVRESLRNAEHHWGDMVGDKGVVAVGYEKTLSKPPTGEMMDLWVNLARDNFKVFNSISEADSGAIPGTDNVVYTRWGGDGSVVSTHRHSDIVRAGKRRQLENNMAQHKEKHCVDGVWDEKKSEREYKKMTAERDALLTV